jgi:hypothetical protein
LSSVNGFLKFFKKVLRHSVFRQNSNVFVLKKLIYVLKYFNKYFLGNPCRLLTESLKTNIIEDSVTVSLQNKFSERKEDKNEQYAKG